MDRVGDEILENGGLSIDRIGERKISWIAWDKTLNSLENGGLGIGSLKAHNLSLLAKWWWSFRKEKSTLWKHVIMDFHGSSGKLGEDAKVEV